MCIKSCSIKGNDCPSDLQKVNTRNDYPNPHNLQQDSKSTADRETWILPFEAIQILSDIASTAPKAQHDPSNFEITSASIEKNRFSNLFEPLAFLSPKFAEQLLQTSPSI